MVAAKASEKHARGMAIFSGIECFGSGNLVTYAHLSEIAPSLWLSIGRQKCRSLYHSARAASKFRRRRISRNISINALIESEIEALKSLSVEKPLVAELNKSLNVAWSMKALQHGGSRWRRKYYCDGGGDRRRRKYGEVSNPVTENLVLLASVEANNLPARNESIYQYLNHLWYRLRGIRRQ